MSRRVDDSRTDDSREGSDDSRLVAGGGVDPPPGAREGERAAGAVDLDESHRRWMTVAAACAVAAAVLLFTAGINAAFVAAVLGAVAWFWDQRNRIRARIIEDEHREEGRDEFEDFDD
ncbi:MAG TPA: hypothetical protein VGV38_14620, partial [Pyrinomonadaceae bacterium]|nr:hypothetical protein [Pyrinomonadaceae bacterium]